MKRERVTITVRGDLLRQIDRMQDNLTIRSRSQAFEFLLSRVLSDIRLNKALVLAGGRKENVLINGKPKFLLDLKGKPLLEVVMERINDFNVGNFLVYVDLKGGEIVKEFESKELSFNVQFLSSKKAQGTVEPLLLAKPFLDDSFLLAYGDTLSSLDLNNMLQFHRKNNALATAALTTVSNPRDYGVVMLEGDHIKRFVQKPKSDLGSYLISAGYFIFEPEIFKHISRKDKSLELDLLPRLAKKNLLLGYPFQGRYVNINSKADLEKARIMV